MAPQVGDNVAGYRLDELIGVGGSDCPVYRATDLKLRQVVAVKLLPKELAGDDFVRRFEREAQLAASLRDHPNVVPVYNFGDTDEVLFLAMRFVRGADLGRLIAEGPLGLARTCVILGQVADALDAAHATGLVHRDVKPGNIFVEPGSTPDGADRVYVGDFGLTLPRDVTSMTRALWSGSPQYLAPERWSGSLPEPTVDVYAIGCVAYACLTGYPPYDGDNSDLLRMAHTHASPPVLSTGHAKVPPAVDQVLARAIAKQPADRYPTCGEFISALRVAAVAPNAETLPGPLSTDAAPHIPVMPYPPRIPVGQTGPIRRTPRWPLAVVAAAAVVLVAGVLVPVLTGPTTIAGGPAPVEGPAPGTSTATLGPDLNAMTFDADGNLYLALRDTSTIKKLTPDGKLTTVVGGNGEGFAGDGGPATKAKIDYPHGLVVDADGNLLIADSSNERIRRVDRKGVITTVAGTGKPGGTGDSGPATKAQLDAPVGLAIGPRGDLYIAEADGNRVRRIDGGGRITTVAGTGVEGFAGDGGLAAQAELSLPLAVAVHGDDLYIADANNSRVRRVDGTGKISTVAGNGQEDSEGDGELATAASMDGPADVTVAPDGTLYIADPNANRIRRVSPDGLMATVAGTGVAGFSGEGGPAAKAQIAGPNAVAVGADGAVYIGDTLNQRVRRIAPNGVFDTVVGKGHDYPGDGLKAPKADLLEPQAARRGPDGATYIADSGNQRVRRVGKDGVISTVAGTGVHGFAGDGGKATDAELAYPTGLDWGSDGTLYIADSGNDRIRAVSKDGVIKTVAGGGTGGDGRADQAGLTSPVDLEVADDGTIYLAEDSGARIRRIGTDGILTTVAGTGEAGYSGDGGPATQAQLNEPTGVHIGRDGSLYVSDFGNSRVRRIDGGGVITTFAGNGTEGFAGDGGPAVDAELIGPYTVATAGDGSLYIADNNSHRVRRVDTNGVITTAVGNGDDGVPDDGDAAGRTMMATPAGLSVTPNGTLLITDIGNDQVYSVGGDGTVHVVAGAT